MGTTSIGDAAHDLKQRLERPTNEWGWERLVAERDAEIERLRERNAEHEARYEALEAKEEYHRRDAERLRAALRKCAAEYRSPPTTVMGGAAYLAEEFQRRMNIAAAALEQQEGK